ncbi:MAG: PleD family two-component system response regulator [Candidatus Omnitrophota bacterium]
MSDTENKKRVFIAEDDESGLLSLKKLLSLSGFEVEGTPHPKEVLSKIKSFKPDVILLDLLMPDLGGLEICQMLNDDKETVGIPIIVVSALAGYADIKQAYKLGVVGYVTKPYDYPNLIQEINKVIGYKGDIS